MGNLYKKFNKVKKAITKKVKRTYKEIQDKNKLVASLTNSEVRKVYKNFISSDMSKEYTERNSKGNYVRKRRKLTENELRKAVRSKVSKENILISVPRLKKKTKTIIKEIKKKTKKDDLKRVKPIFERL